MYNLFFLKRKKKKKTLKEPWVSKVQLIQLNIENYRNLCLSKGSNLGPLVCETSMITKYTTQTT